MGVLPPYRSSRDQDLTKTLAQEASGLKEEVGEN
jgi:hypothetical protein